MEERLFDLCWEEHTLFEWVLGDVAASGVAAGSRDALTCCHAQVVRADVSAHLAAEVAAATGRVAQRWQHLVGGTTDRVGGRLVSSDGRKEVSLAPGGELLLIGLPAQLARDCLFRFEAFGYRGLGLCDLLVPGLLV